MKTIRVTRMVQLPDPVRLSRYRKAPELGPRLLFFSGGTALNDASRLLKEYTHNSTHLVTPFDSGGSSAKLRRAFAMPSIGDLRSRLMALADENITGNPEVYRLFTHRFPKRAPRSDLLEQLDSMIAGRESRVVEIPNPMRRLIRTQLGYFRAAMPENFDLQGASIGNLILTGGYLNNHQHLDPIIFLFSKLVGVLGTVRAVVNEDLHLGADLENGARIMGQHRLTGKEEPPLTAPVSRLFLSRHPVEYEPVTCSLRKMNRNLIREAELVCYPYGSFYSSLIANLLPQGVGAAVAATDCPKVYIPNLGRDPEQVGMSLDQSVQILLKYLRADTAPGCRNQALLNFILIDSQRGEYRSRLSAGLMRELDIEVIDIPLVSSESAPFYDPRLLVAALLSLI